MRRFQIVVGEVGFEPTAKSLRGRRPTPIYELPHPEASFGTFAPLNDNSVNAAGPKKRSVKVRYCVTSSHRIQQLDGGMNVRRR